jgi:phosphotransferase system enzyme I (PtsP)
MAGKPISAMALIGIGYRSVSMSPAAIGPVKAMLLGLDAGLLSRTMNDALDDKTSTIPMRDILKRFAEAHNIPL